MRILKTDLDEYFGRVFFIELDHLIGGIEIVSNAHI